MKIKFLFLLLILNFSGYSQVQLGPIAGAVTETSSVVVVKTYSPEQ